MRFNVATDDYGNLMMDIYTALIQGSNNNLLQQSVWVLHQQNVNRKPFRWLILELALRHRRQHDVGHSPG
jgi:DNA-binding GntR family transcriptional regulator